MFQVKNAIQALQELATTSSNARFPFSVPARSNPDLPENVKRPQTAVLQRSSSHPPEVFGWDGPYDSPAHHPQYHYNGNSHHYHQQHQQYHHHHHHQQQCQLYQQQQPHSCQSQQLQLQYYQPPAGRPCTDVAVQTDVAGVDLFERFVKTHRSLVLEWLNENDHVSVTVYDEETVANDSDGDDGDGGGNSGGGGGLSAAGQLRDERSPSASSSASSASSSASPPPRGREARATAATGATATDEEPTQHVAAAREWFPTVNPPTAAVGEISNGGDVNETNDGGGAESIEMTHVAATGPKSLKFYPFV